MGKRKAVLSQHQKFHKCQIVTQQLASLASEVGMAEFDQRFHLLKTLKDAWANGKMAVVSVETGRKVIVTFCIHSILACEYLNVAFHVCLYYSFMFILVF